MDQRILLPCVALGLALATACDDTLYQPTHEYAADWGGMQQLMNDNCKGCHTSDPEAGAAPHMPQDIERDVVCGNGWYVVPGDPDHSLFYTVLLGLGTDGHTGAQGLMPRGTPGLPQKEIDAVKTWIENGATIPSPTVDCTDTGGSDTDTGTTP